MITLRTSCVFARALAASAAVIALSACGADDLTEKVIESQLGKDANVSIDSDSGEVVIEDGEGGSYASTGRVPDSYPSAVPVPEGAVISGIVLEEAGKTSWTVSVQVEQSGLDAFDENLARLLEAGFTAESEMTGELSSAWLTDGTYTVVMGSIDQGDGTALVTYQVMED